MFIKVRNMLINLDNVTNIAKRGKKCIRICFLAKRDYVDLETDNEEELDRIWEKLGYLLEDE